MYNYALWLESGVCYCLYWSILINLSVTERVNIQHDPYVVRPPVIREGLRE